MIYWFIKMHNEPDSLLKQTFLTHFAPLHRDPDVSWLYDVETICQVTLRKQDCIYVIKTTVI